MKPLIAFFIGDQSHSMELSVLMVVLSFKSNDYSFSEEDLNWRNERI